MNLAPLLGATQPIPFHVACAIAGFGLGTIQLVLPKGTKNHKRLGYAWVGLMLAIALTSLFITSLNPGHFSVIHLLSVFTLVMLPLGVWHARSGNIRRHKRTMLAIYIGALLVAGTFAFTPNRIMYQVVWGG